MSNNIGTLLIELKANMKTLQTQLNKLDKTGLQAGTKTAKGFGKGFSMMGRFISPQTIALVALTAGFKKTIDLTKQFTKTMSEVQAVSKATDAEMKSLTVQSKELGRTTEYTANEVGKGMVFLSRAGLTAKEQLEAIGPVLNFATANNIELAKSADIATNIMSQYGKTVSDLPEIMDILSETTSSSNTDILQLAEAMKYAGPTAKALDISLAETASAIGILGNNGLQGSLATRALGTSLVRLSKPTKQMQVEMKKLGLDVFDAEGKFVGINGLIGQLETGFAGYTDEQKQASLATIFGAEAIQEMNILLSAGSEKLDTFTSKLENSKGQTENMANTMRDNMQGSLDAFVSALQGVAITVGEELGPAIREVLDAGAEFLQRFNDMIDGPNGATQEIAELNETLEELAERQSEVSESINELTQDFINGKVGPQEYRKELKDLIKERTDLVAQAEEIKAIVEEETKRYEALSEVLVNNESSTQDLAQQQVELAETTDKTTDKYKKQEKQLTKNMNHQRNLTTVQEGFKDKQHEIQKVLEIVNYKLRTNAKLQGHNTRLIESHTKAGESLEQVQQRLNQELDSLTDTYVDQHHALDKLGDANSWIQDTFNSFSTAKTQDEFKALQIEAIKTIDIYLKVAQTQLEAFKGTKIKDLDPSIQQLAHNAKKLISAKQELLATAYAPPKTTPTNTPQPPPSGGGENKESKDQQKETEKLEEEYVKQQIKNLEKVARAKRIRIYESIKNEKLRNTAIKAIDDQLTVDRLTTEGKLQEAQELTAKNSATKSQERLKREKELQDQSNDIFDDLKDQINDSTDALEDYKEKISDIAKEYESMADSAQDAIYDINKSLVENQSELGGNLANRYVSVQDEIKDLQSKEERSPEDTAKLAELEKERQLIIANTSEEQRREALRQEGLSSSQKLIEQGQQENQILQERKRLAELVQQAYSDREIDEEGNLQSVDLSLFQTQVDEATGVMQAFYTDDEGTLIQVTDTKNAQYIIDTLNKATQLEAQLEETRLAYEEEKTLHEQLQQTKIKLEQDFQVFLEHMKNKEMAIAEKLRQKRLAVARARAKAGGGGSGRVKGGPVEAGTSYLVGENPDGSINRTTELFVPNVSGSIVPAGTVQSALKTIQNSNVSNSNKVRNVNINLGGYTQQTNNISHPQEMAWDLEWQLRKVRV